MDGNTSNDGLTDNEMARLEAAASEREWNATCDAVKRARGGAYPGDWFARVMATGLAARKAAQFGR